MRSTTSGGETQLGWGATVVQSWGWFVLFNCSTEFSFHEERLFITPPLGWAHLERDKVGIGFKKKRRQWKERGVPSVFYRAFSCTPTISTSLSEDATLIWPLRWAPSLRDSAASTWPETNERAGVTRREEEGTLRASGLSERPPRTVVERWRRCGEVWQHKVWSWARQRKILEVYGAFSPEGMVLSEDPLASHCPVFTGSSGNYQFTGFVTDLKGSSQLLYTQSELPNPGLCAFLAHALSPWAGLSPHSYSPGLNQCLKYHSDTLLEARLQRTKRTLHYSNQAWRRRGRREGFGRRRTATRSTPASQQKSYTI